MPPSSTRSVQQQEDERDEDVGEIGMNTARLHRSHPAGERQYTFLDRFVKPLLEGRFDLALEPDRRGVIG